MNNLQSERLKKSLTTPKRRRTAIDLIIREGSSLAFSAALFYMLWLGETPAPATADQAMWYVCGVAVVCLLYVLLQAISAVRLPMGRDTGPLTDMLFSLIPLFILGYRIIDWFRLGTEPPDFQIILVILTSLATFTDVIVFTWFSLRLNRFAPEIVPMD
ncbi:MAG TPA: hypothetical protein VKA94_15685 [Hyphomicrobiales bacterium]|nr:hypothetical protein [Hyphomicrobiales bacterium]